MQTDIESPKRRTITSRPLLAGALALGAVAFLPATAFSQDSNIGKQEYMDSCAVCHGPDGNGYGPMADLFKPVPPNLTQLSKNNNGVFPFQQVFDVIDGRPEVRAHGPRDMPVWGSAFEIKGGDRYGPAGEMTVKGRILSLTQYIRSIQAE